MKVQISEQQKKACNTAIHAFIKSRAKVFGNGAVILLPEFKEQADKTWAPVAGSLGARPTSNNSAFMRFGKVTTQMTGTAMKEVFTYSNVFGSEGSSAEDLMEGLLTIDPNAKVGTTVKGVRLVIHESVVPFSRTNPERDIKWADQNAGIACVKYVPDSEGVVQERMIYRRTMVFTADPATGDYPAEAVNRFIAHDNKEQISEAAFAKWSQSNKANTPALQKKR